MFSLPILTFITGFASFGMFLLFADEFFRRINNKISSLKEENKALTSQLKILKGENNELVDKICQMTLTNDNLQTEINRIQPEEELVDENIRLVTMCGNLHKKYHMLKQELKAFDSIEITNIQLNNSFDSFITNKLTLSYP
jgi:predicted nuclease with TOPRIM domain